MKTSLQWLRTYLPEAPTAEACGEALTMAGMPVEVFEKYEGDDVFDVEVTSNRSDLLSHFGVARELGALLKLSVTPPPTEIPSGAVVQGGEGVKVRVEDPAGCPVYTARIIRGVKVGPSPLWMQRHLQAVGLRPINNVVDITNFVLLEMGQPLHAFDLAKLGGGADASASAEIVVRRARAGEELVSLDGHTRKLAGHMLVIADAGKPVALAGIMGGKDSEVTEATTDVLLESAIFEPLIVRKTSRELALRSDSSYRFERGIDPTLPERASDRAARLMVELAGGKVSGPLVRVGPPTPPAKKLSLRFEKLTRVLGYEITKDEAVDALARLRMNPELSVDAKAVKVSVPPDRLDVNIEVDLVEEVARVVGYGRIPQKETIEVRVSPPDLVARSMGLVNEVAAGAGYFEAITFSFVSDALSGDFLPDGAKGLPRADHGTRKADAKLRPSLVPGLLEALRRNEAGGNGQVKLYEVGSTFCVDAAGKLLETRKVAVVGGTELRETRGVVEALLARLDARQPVKVEPAKVSGYDSAGVVYWGGRRVGVVGVVSKSVAGKADLRHVPCAAELELTPLVENTRHVPQLVPLPKYPAVERDVSLVVREQVKYDALQSLLAGLNLADLESAAHVTTYRGKPLDKGVKSVTMRLVFRSGERSLKAEEVDAAVNAFVAKATGELGAVVRV